MIRFLRFPRNLRPIFDSAHDYRIALTTLPSTRRAVPLVAERVALKKFGKRAAAIME